MTSTNLLLVPFSGHTRETQTCTGHKAGVRNLRPTGTCELKNKYFLYQELETFIGNKGQNQTFLRIAFAA